MCEPRFAAVEAALAASLGKDDVGASVAVYLDGEPVVDLWGGYADADRTVGWERDTLTGVNSTTKNMTALCALVLADQGRLDLSGPVADYWPEFATAGKERLLVRHVLSHTAGLPDLSGPTAVEDLYDWQRVTAGLAAQAPEWEPGTAAGYHGLTFGFLIGEIVRRITGRPLGDFFAEEVAKPLGADFHIGLSADDDRRVVPLIPPPSRTDEYTADAPTGPDGTRREYDGVAVRVRDANSVAWRRAQIPAVNGFGESARSVAPRPVGTGGTGVPPGAYDCCPPRAASLAWQEVFRGEDRVLRTSMSWTVGFGKFGNMFGWGGWGGACSSRATLMHG
ncbi:serine hydrolase domain-containing protein [Streptomyces sp. L7]